MKTLNLYPQVTLFPTQRQVSPWLRDWHPHLPAVGPSASDLTSLFLSFLIFIMEVIYNVSAQTGLREKHVVEKIILGAFFLSWFSSTSHNA